MSRRELKAERRRREILRSAARSFRSKGFHATTMEDIAADLLMTQGSLQCLANRDTAVPNSPISTAPDRLAPLRISGTDEDMP